VRQGIIRVWREREPFINAPFYISEGSKRIWKHAKALILVVLTQTTALDEQPQHPS